ncbi:MAG: hypothetical protein COA43_01585 [Robiginitomaculum sp.]|nr:MAG: hypothetical protein COA43_01585 [Robiginitomaculum sp.]
MEPIAMDIPNYGLYGEKERDVFPEYIHIESIRSRSVQHGWKFRPHRHHNLYQFFFISNGGGKYQIDGRFRELGENQVLVIAPMIIHGFKFLPKTEGWVLTIPDIYLQILLQHEPKSLENLAGGIHFQCTREDISKQFCILFDEIAVENQRNLVLSQLSLKGYITLLIAKILTEQPKIDVDLHVPLSRKQLLMNEFKTLISEHYKKRIGVSDYAGLLGITATHLTRICKNLRGVSALKLIDDRTLLETQRLLIYTSMTIAEISYELGFNDPAHFSKYFYNKTEQNPTQFRKGFMQK